METILRRQKRILIADTDNMEKKPTYATAEKFLSAGKGFRERLLIVVSNPTSFTDEALHINNLFNAGLQVFHLRKPDASIEGCRDLLNQIKPEYHAQIALHQHHQLAEEFGIKRLHFTEQQRLQTTEKVLEELVNKDYILSTSIHQLNNYKLLNNSFKYSFYGPVFDSISKPGYKAVIARDEAISDRHFDYALQRKRNLQPKEQWLLTPRFLLVPRRNDVLRIAIGGIKAENIQTLKTMYFDGAAVLGSIWQMPDKSVDQFKTLQKLWS